MKWLIFIFCSLIVKFGISQSYNDDKTSAINYIKRVYNTTEFHVVKLIEGYEKEYIGVSLSYPKDSSKFYSTNISNKIQQIAEKEFSKPCIRFEMIEHLQSNNDKKNTYLYICETLENFVFENYKTKKIDGVKLIVSPNNKYLVSIISLDNSKFLNNQERDKVAFMKAKQMTNTFLNGSIISSESIIKLDNNGNVTENESNESIKENSMGFVSGVQLLETKEFQPNNIVYAFYVNL